jgi:hypothetical protein
MQNIKDLLRLEDRGSIGEFDSAYGADLSDANTSLREGIPDKGFTAQQLIDLAHPIRSELRLYQTALGLQAIVPTALGSDNPTTAEEVVATERVHVRNMTRLEGTSPGEYDLTVAPAQPTDGSTDNLRFALKLDPDFAPLKTQPVEGLKGRDLEGYALQSVKDNVTNAYKEIACGDAKVSCGYTIKIDDPNAEHPSEFRVAYFVKADEDVTSKVIVKAQYNNEEGRYELSAKVMRLTDKGKTEIEFENNGEISFLMRGGGGDDNAVVYKRNLMMHFVGSAFEHLKSAEELVGDQEFLDWVTGLLGSKDINMLELRTESAKEAIDMAINFGKPMVEAASYAIPHWPHDGPLLDYAATVSNIVNALQNPGRKELESLQLLQFKNIPAALSQAYDKVLTRLADPSEN